jgi:hypothetical protein
MMRVALFALAVLLGFACLSTQVNGQQRDPSACMIIIIDTAILEHVCISFLTSRLPIVVGVWKHLWVVRTRWWFYFCSMCAWREFVKGK